MWGNSTVCVVHEVHAQSWLPSDTPPLAAYVQGVLGLGAGKGWIVILNGTRWKIEPTECAMFTLTASFSLSEEDIKKLNECKGDTDWHQTFEEAARDSGLLVHFSKEQLDDIRTDIKTHMAGSMGPENRARPNAPGGIPSAEDRSSSGRLAGYHEAVSEKGGGDPTPSFS